MENPQQKIDDLGLPPFSGKLHLIQVTVAPSAVASAMFFHIARWWLGGWWLGLVAGELGF